MMTMDSETISVVPLTGRLKTTLPTTSATTRKHSRKASTAASTSSTWVSRSLRWRSVDMSQLLT